MPRPLCRAYHLDMKRRSFLVMLCGCVAVVTTAGGRPLIADEPSADRVKFITHNVWYGFTKKPDPRRERWRAWMAAEAPDVVALQELNGFTPETLAADASSWGHQHSALLKEDGFPTGITSRFPIHDVVRIREGFHHGLLRCRIEGLWIYVIHFHPSNYDHRSREAARLAKYIASLPGAAPQILLAGDFNGPSPLDRVHYTQDTQLIPFFTRLDEENPQARNLNAGRLDYGGLQAILDQGFVDVVSLSQEADALFAGTFPSQLVRDEDHGTSRRIDYIFVSPNLREHVESAAILHNATTDMLSDHLPVTTTLRLGPPD